MKTHKASQMQLKAICQGDGPVRILAGPGSGKTFTIIQRIHHLITHFHIPPDKILCVTFTKAAALTMEQRFYREFPQDISIAGSKVYFSTLHSLCYQILKESGSFYQYSLAGEFTKRTIIKQLLENTGIVQEADSDMIFDLLSAVSRQKNIPKDNSPVFLTKEQFAALFLSYEKMLRERKLLDFDDMIYETCKLFRENPRLLQKWQSTFSYLLVDEFQDINEYQYEVIRLLAAPKNNLFIVGDDDQSIYGFRGAAPGIMKQFETDYPSCAKEMLTENYRSGSKIVALASKMIQANTNRLSKEPAAVKTGGSIGIYFKRTVKEEEELLLMHLKTLSAKELSDTAIILRTNREVYRYTELLKGAGLPLRQKKEEASDYLHHFIMEDICAFLRFIKEGRHREDFLKIMNKPERYLSRQALTEAVVQLEDVASYYGQNRQMRTKLQKLFAQYDSGAVMIPTLAVRYFRQVMGYDLYLAAAAKNNSEKILFTEYAETIQKLFREMKTKEYVDDFLRRMEIEQSQKGNAHNHNKAIKSNLTEANAQLTEGISVMTMHGAKGLEFTHVFLPDLNEGVIPGRSCKTKESLEEERRLLYVAITRAKEYLYLYYTCERGRKPTRFLEKLLSSEQKWY